MHEFVQALSHNPRLLFGIPDLWHQAELHSISLGVYSELKKISENCEAPVDVLMEYRQAIKQQKLAEKIVLELQKHGKIVTLNGFVLGRICFHDIGYKKINELELLVYPEDLKTFENVLRSLGFTKLYVPTKETDYLAPPWVSSDGTLMICFYFRLASEKRFLSETPVDFISEAVSYTWNNQVFLRLSDTHLFFHLLLNLPLFKCGLREARDFFGVASHLKIDHHELEKLVHLYSAYDAVLHVHYFLTCFFPRQRFFSMSLILQCVSKNRFVWLKKYHSRLSTAAQKNHLPLRSRFPGQLEKKLSEQLYFAQSFSLKVKTFLSLLWMFFAWGIDDSGVALRSGARFRFLQIILSHIHESIYDHGPGVWLKAICYCGIRCFVPKRQAIVSPAVSEKLKPQFWLQ